MLICTRPGIAGLRAGAEALASMLAEGMPVRTNDFSQSAVEGPRMFPSIQANPGQREHEARCVQDEHVCMSRARIERTSFSSGESRQMSMNFCRRKLPLGRGNCTQG